MTDVHLNTLRQQIKSWGKALGFAQIGISSTDLPQAETALAKWLAQGYHGTMQWMATHGAKRSQPAQLVAGTLRVISARLDYWPDSAQEPWSVLHDPQQGYISRYALGRDYHKVVRQRLQQLADRITAAIGPFGHRVFCDSAPVLEKPLAEKAGLGWVGKHSNLLQREHGSYFFLGEIYTDLPLPVDNPSSNHCGDCQRCIDVCPTQAIVAPYVVDARRCISYLTIELRDAIPVELRPLLGNRIYGCDDCQLVCPWNRFAQPTQVDDFQPRHGLDAPALVALFRWNEAEFLQRTAGMAIRRIGYECWSRNIAVALGNAPSTVPVLQALHLRREDPSALVREHVQWALQRHAEVKPG
ncbi:MAG: tRNA epoxyqueuosine(34) reductase QueG [Gammaproteobacteria bacterium]|nr:tRNA epoxyqueuosine(34) reductase QueG [Gammaproteobacteria bacterium]